MELVCSHPIDVRRRPTHSAVRAVCLAIVFVSFGVTSSAVAQQPEVIIEVDRQQVYLGESITYNVTLNHVEDPSQPDLSQLNGFDVSFNGQQSLNSSSITIINGRRSEVIRRGMLYQYRLTPRNAGQQTIPAPSVTIDGETLTGRAVDINVIAPEEQDLVILNASVDRESVYPLQPFTISLTIAVRQLPGELADRSPLSVQGRDPARLTVPWLEDESLPEGLKPEQSWRDILEPLISGPSRRGGDGFQINEIGSQSAFSLFERSRKAVFLPRSERTVRQDADGNDVGYVEYKLERTFIPQRIGTYRFAASNVKGTFGTEIVDQSLDGREIYAVTNSITVTVKDVPLDGRPDCFVGAIGTFDVSSDITPRTAAVGDPVTLSMTIHGEGTISEIRPPDLSAIEGVDQKFRVYDATQETIGNGKVFRWSLRPLDESVTEFPAIPVGYFDVQQEKYEIAEAAAIPLEITAARELTASDIVATTGTDSTQRGAGVELNDAGLFANYSGLNTLRGSNASLSVYMPIWGAMLLGYVGISFGLKRRQLLRSDPTILKRRTAKHRAVEELHCLITESGGDERVSPEVLSRIIARLIADFTGVESAGMTSTDAQELLSKAEADSRLIQRVTAFFDRCDAARYGGDGGDASLTADCKSLINDVSEELRQR